MIANGPVGDFTRQSSLNHVLVRSPQARDLAALIGQRLAGEGSVRAAGPGELNVIGLTAVEVGDLAFENQIRLHELSTKEASLEDAFLEMTGGAQEFQAHGHQPGGGWQQPGAGWGGPPPGQQPPPGWSGPQQGGPPGPPPGPPYGGPQQGPPHGGPQQHGENPSGPGPGDQSGGRG